MKTHVYKLFNSKRNRKLHQIINISGLIWNHCIAVHKRYYRLYGKHLSKYDLQKHITKLKKLQKFKHWNKVPSQSIQDITDRIDKSYRAFFDWTKKKTKLRKSPPGFRKIKKYKSFTLKQAGWKIEGNTIWLNGYKFGFHKSRELLGQVKTITVKRDSLDHIYVYITFEYDVSDLKPTTGKIAGFDFGLPTFLTSDSTNDRNIDMPRFYFEKLKKLKKASRKLSLKQTGSHNKEKARKDLARLHKQVENSRRDFHYKLAVDLVREFDTLCFETLNLDAMKRLWGRKVSDYALGSFLEFLTFKASEYGRKVVFIDQFYPSSKTCSKCGYILAELSLKTRQWNCPECGASHHRDINAADNILRVGASTRAADSVRPA